MADIAASPFFVIHWLKRAILAGCFASAARKALQRQQCDPH
jgi:hypothetical protein